MKSLSLAPVPVLPDGIVVPDAALRQDGVFSRAQARCEGWTDERMRRLIREGLWVPIAGSALRHREVEEGPWQLARAVRLTGGRVISHNVAGLLWQFEVPVRLTGIGRTQRVPQPVEAHRLEIPKEECVDVRGMLVTNPLRTLTDLLCTLFMPDGVTMLTDGFRRGLMSAADVREAVNRAHGRYGVTGARALAHSCRREPHSFLEWRYHGLMDRLGPGWTFNVDIYDDQGFVGRVDALHEASGTIVELDSRKFHGEERFQADRTRDQRLAALGYVVIRLTWDDVQHRPTDVVERIRRTVSLRSRVSTAARASISASRMPQGARLADQPPAA